MAESTWEKSPELAAKLKPRATQRWIYLFAGLGLIGVVIFLVVNGTLLGSSYYKTIEEVSTDPELVGKKIRMSGAVVMGDIDDDGNLENDVHFDKETNTLTFQLAHISNDNDEIRDQGGLGKVLAKAVTDDSLPILTVVYTNEEIPDLMYGDEPTQAIVQGKLGENGIFYATSLQTKCPTKYADDVSNQVETQ